MPNTQQPADFIASFQDVLRRLDALERTPPNAMSDITASPDLAGTAAAPATSNVWTQLTHANVQFTLSRPGTVFIVGHIAFAGTVGTDSYVETRLARLAGNGQSENHTLADVDANFVSANSGANYQSATPYIVEALPIGTYTVTFQYKTTGATTTMNASTPAINVFLMGG